jgi:hypothetical protein
LKQERLEFEETVEGHDSVEQEDADLLPSSWGLHGLGGRL